MLRLLSVELILVMLTDISIAEQIFLKMLALLN